MFALCTGCLARRTEKQWAAASCTLGWPQIPAQRQVTLTQHVQLVERRAARIIAQRAGKFTWCTLARADNRVVRDVFGQAWTQAEQVSPDAVELFRRQARTDVLRQRRG